ncbi:MAG TPA: tol-pal system protein YbgF [Alphaproteobacteria bacterium]|nr:tol-pal system protein YbgF [Alphaproteobacteria bacterium]
MVPLGLAVILLALAPAPLARAQSGESQALIQRLDRLERDMKTLERSVYRGEKPPQPPAGDTVSSEAGTSRLADTEVRMSRLESEMRDMTGRIEELGFRVNQLGSRLDKLVADVDLRLRELEQGKGTAANGAPSGQSEGQSAEGQSTEGQSAGGQPAGQQQALGEEEEGSAAAGGAAKPGQQILPQGSAMDQYVYARSLLRKLDFDGAQQAFQEFLQKHPDDKLAGNAFYWLGETHFARAQYQEAAKTFVQGYKRFPEGAKAPDTLLKLAITLRKMEQPKEACATLAELKKRFPQVSRPIGQRLQQESKELSCS